VPPLLPRPVLSVSQPGAWHNLFLVLPMQRVSWHVVFLAMVEALLCERSCVNA
jgi:hypothetical protein